MAKTTTKLKPKAAPRVKATAPREAASTTADFVARTEAALKRRDPDAVADTELQTVLAAALRLYAAKFERRADLAPYREGAVTATESVVAACALIRAADLNLF